MKHIHQCVQKILMTIKLLNFTYKTSPKPLAMELNAQWKLPTVVI